jgi:drug/metabolite transporter (DMT)-like permease
MLIQTWVVLALISAFALATSDALAKKSLRTGGEYTVAWLRLVFTLPLLVCSWLLVPTPALDRTFYAAFMTALPIELFTIVLFFKALKASPLSLTLPFLALTPVVLIAVSYVMLGERVSLQGGTGIVLIAAGSYTLNIRELRQGILGPFRAIGRERGSVMMIIVALCYSLTSTLGKTAIEHSSPLFFGITYYIALAVCFTPIAAFLDRESFRRIGEGGEIRVLVLAGLFNAVMVVTHMWAIKLAKVAYMISVKRVSLLIGVAYGHLFFREREIGARMTGAVLMFAGFVLVVTAR